VNKTHTSLLCAFSSAIIFTGLYCSEISTPVSYKDNTDMVSITPVISSNWLDSNLNNKNYVVIDVRSAQEFSAGKIPNSINIPFEIPISTWTDTVNGLLVEVPEISQLATQLGANGISKSSKVVLVTSLPSELNPYALASPTRVALTLAYAGLEDISILDGGFDTWASQGKLTTTKTTVVTPVTYDYAVGANLFVQMDYVKSNLGKFILVDARDTEVYTGSVIEPFANKAGHIPTALSLPAPSLWNSNGTYKSKAEIEAIADKIVGTNKDKEIVIYCGVGGYASTVWFALTKILDYKNVKVYDGSAQEWVLTNDMVM
jgi:thiosulfate/3-mercaptopyruvate sulfurtransferase